MESSVGKSSQAAETTQEELDQIQRSTKRRFWTNKDPADSHTSTVSFAEMVSKGMDNSEATPTGAPMQDSMMKEGEVGEEEEWTDDASEWDTESDSDESTQEDATCPTISLSKKEKLRLRQPWSSSLIIKLVGMNMGYGALSRRLRTLWKPSGSFDIIDVGNEFYVVKFGSIVDLRRVLSDGPWVISDHYLLVQKWKPDFDPMTAELNNLIVWVRFPHVALEYFDKTFLHNLARKVGKVIKVDTATKMATRGKYARVCVEVDLSKPLLSRYNRKGKVYRILYESLHLLCYECGRYGHSEEHCKGTRDKTQKDNQSTADGKENEKESNQIYGPWMTVQKQRFKRGGRRPHWEDTNTPKKPMVNPNHESPTDIEGSRSSLGKSSRFAPLQEEGVDQGIENADNQIQTERPVTETGPSRHTKGMADTRKETSLGYKENVNPNANTSRGVRKADKMQKEGKGGSNIDEAVTLPHGNKTADYCLPKAIEKAKDKASAGKDGSSTTHIVDSSLIPNAQPLKNTMQKGPRVLTFIKNLEQVSHNPPSHQDNNVLKEQKIPPDLARLNEVSKEIDHDMGLEDDNCMVLEEDNIMVHEEEQATGMEMDLCAQPSH